MKDLKMINLQIFKSFNLSILLFFILLIAGCGKEIIKESSEEGIRFRNLSVEILEDLFRFYPVMATEQGVHRYDHLLAAYNSFSISEEVIRLKDFEERLKEINPRELNLDDQIDYLMISSNIEMNLFTLDQWKEWERNPQLYVEECIRGIFSLLPRDFNPSYQDSSSVLKERIVHLEKRLFQVPRLFKEARENVKNPPRVIVEAALEELEKGREFIEETISRMVHRYPQEQSMLMTAKILAVEAMTDYWNYLNSIMDGVNGEFAIGKETYDNILKRKHFLNLDSEQLLELGERVLRETRAEIGSLESFETQEFPLPSPPVEFSKEDVLEYYQWEMDTVMKFYEEMGWVAFPEGKGKCWVVETPGFLQDLFSEDSYLPPETSLNGEAGVLLVRSIPEKFTEQDRIKYFAIVKNRKFRKSVIRLTTPELPLQNEFANRNLSNVRQFQNSPLFRKGWAFYCEGMMGEEGHFEEKGSERDRLKRTLYQAARVILDARLHTRSLNFEEGVNFLVEEFGEEERETFEEEVITACLSPTESICELIGGLQIVDLRKMVKEKMGKDYSLKRFHDLLLSEGIIPIPLIEKKILQSFGK